jgi:hypothetical protein
MKLCMNSFCKRYGKKCNWRCWFHRWARVTPEVFAAQEQHRKEILRSFFLGT